MQVGYWCRMSDFPLHYEQDVDRVLGLDTDHVTERQTGEKADPSDLQPTCPNGARTTDDTTDDAAAEALVDAGGTAIERRGDDHTGGTEIEGPNSA